MTRTLDISQLAPPTIVRPYDWDGDIAGFVQDLSTRLPAWRGVFESDSFLKICESWATRLTLKDAQHNRDARAMLLAFTTGADLDHIATTYFRTQRPVIRQATATEPEILMGDDEYRALAQLAPEATSDFGLTPGGYVYKVRTEFADRIKDVRTINRGNGRIEMRVLGRDGDGIVPPATLAEIAAAFAPEGASQSTDVLSVFSAEVPVLEAAVTLVMPVGPDPAPVVAAARTALEALSSSLHKLGATVWVEAVSTAAHLGPVLTVRIDGIPVETIGRTEAAPLLKITMAEPEIRR